MAKTSSIELRRYLERIGGFNEAINKLLSREKETMSQIRQDSEEAGMKRVALAEDMLSLTSNYIIVNGISQVVLGAKNEEALNNARKSLYKCIIYLERVVSNHVDAPFSDYEEKLAGIAPLDAAARYLLVRKIGLALQLVEDAYGDNTKWRWSFVELEGRFATVAKNIMDLKKAVVNTDPRSPEYEPTVYHLRLIKKLLAQTADRYREKYELSTKNVEDFNMGIHFLSALRRLYSVLGPREETEMTKKKLDIWTAKLEADVKKNTMAPPKRIQDEDDSDTEE
ncbi:hypothetical protein [Treponema primitia]|uniref:hypothetical protein n=1 Tax=Treponema primitia TaxID=88058 RepID=UPI0002555703|nr:hypothetical protein [Treponema primitia]